MGSTRVGAIRSSQVITTYGPGALVDLPKHSVIVAGLDTWRPKKLKLIVEPRLTEKIRHLTGGPPPQLYSPPPDRSGALGGSASSTGYIGVRRFPEWFVVQRPDGSKDSGASESSGVSRRLVHLSELENGRFEGQSVVATRFVRACPNGHVDDLDWRHFVHSGHTSCRRPLWLDERGQSGDLADLVVRCQCGQQRRLSEAGDWNEKPLGDCRGQRPWLGKYATEPCNQPSRLLIRTASNAYFSQVVRVLSIPDSEAPVMEEVEKHWSVFQAVTSQEVLEQLGVIPDVKAARDRFGDDALIEAIRVRSAGTADDRPAKQVELDAFLSAPEGFGDDVPVNPDFHARRLAEHYWRSGNASDGIDAVVQLHRLREVSALVGFTRLEAAVPDIDGEYDTDVTRAHLDEDPSWFPAVENRGEGVFLSLDSAQVADWLGRTEVQRRIDGLSKGHALWLQRRKKEKPAFPGGPYVLLHTLAHLLMQAVSLRCGYPATSIRERIYVNSSKHQYGLLLYTASPDADGTLGGLVEQARHIEEHLSMAQKSAELCSSDPICAQHAPVGSPDERWLHGAACHSCSLIAETSCEMRNEYLDRALVVPTVDDRGAAYFNLP
ncbi:MAG: DUF1998 domain-containing protein [Acidobacteriia bacterium]|nr:DUF1998 domain-containing protein [Terriglobia bacterium]MYG01892.1 DUF1998 domain-containing protein [Terriglobia bacterium]MYK10553.1 DUF1998 domain-containing protein [Terriglobia bacterium]